MKPKNRIPNLKKSLLLAGSIVVLWFLTVAAQDQNPVALAPLPDVPIPKDQPLTPSKVELGRLLFFDPRLSGDGSISCADCHDPKKGWGDGNDLSRGYPGTVHWRNSQTILNAAFLKNWFWTSSAPSLEKQAEGAMTGAVAGNLVPLMAVERVKRVQEYVHLFKDAFQSAPTYEGILQAIAAFERTVVSRNVPFDKYMKGAKSALTTKAVQGKALFEGKAGCIQCHSGPLLTDEQFHNVAVPKNPAFEKDPLRQITMRERMRKNNVPEEVVLSLDRDPGRYIDTKKEEDKGRFRTPPLRELVYTAPYMHNGVFFTLEEVVDFYDKGGDDDPFGTKSDKIKPLQLTAEEKAALVAFLESLSGDEIIVERPKLPAYGVLPLPMKGTW
jgi:cytochrome c peroxidase